MRQEYILAGSGGQGLVMMGIILGQAAAEEGYTVAQTQSYGIATRGGVSFSEVVVSDEEILYPKTVMPDFIMTLTEETYSKFRRIYPESRIFADLDEVEEHPEDKLLIRVPMSSYCRSIHNMRALNMLAIGMVVGATGLIEPEVMERVIQKKFPEAYETNVKALHKGIEFTKSAR